MRCAGWTWWPCRSSPPTAAESVLLGPGGEELAALLGVDLLALLEGERATGVAGEVTALPVAPGGPDNPDLRLVLLVGVGAARPADLRRAGAELARAVRRRDAVATSVPAVAGPEGIEAFVVGAMLGSFTFHWRSTPPEDAARHPGGPGRRPGRRGPRRTTGDRDRRRRVARPRAGHGPLESQEPRLARRAGRGAGRRGRSRGHRLGRAAPRRGGLRRRDRRRSGLGDAAAPDPPRLHPAQGRAAHAHRGARRQGHHLRHRRAVDQARPGHDHHEARHDGRRRGALDHGRAARPRLPGARRRAGPGGRERRVGQLDASRRRRAPLRRSHQRGHQHRRRGPPGPRRRAGLCRRRAGPGCGRRRRHAHRCDEGRARPAPRRVLRQPRRPRGRDRGRPAPPSGEELWRFPLASVYEDKLSSKVADADNAAGGPGAITAALFLQHFVGDVPWAHLDVASVGDAPEERHEWTTGPTGFGARALLQWLGGTSPLAGIG